MVEGRPAPEGEQAKVSKQAGGDELKPPAEPKVLETDPKILGATPDPLLELASAALEQGQRKRATPTQELAFLDFSAGNLLSTEPTAKDSSQKKALKPDSAAKSAIPTLGATEALPASFTAAAPAELTSSTLQPPKGKTTEAPVLQTSPDATDPITPVKVRTVRVTSSDPVQYTSTFRPVEEGKGYEAPKFEAAKFNVSEKVNQTASTTDGRTVYDILKDYKPQAIPDTADGKGCQSTTDGIAFATNYSRPESNSGSVPGQKTASPAWDVALSSTPIAYQKVPFSGTVGQGAREGEGPTVLAVMQSYDKYKGNGVPAWDSSFVDKTPVANWGAPASGREVQIASKESAGRAIQLGAPTGEEGARIGRTGEEAARIARTDEGGLKELVGAKETGSGPLKDGSGLPSNALGGRELVAQTNTGGPQLTGKELAGQQIGGPRALAAAETGPGGQNPLRTEGQGPRSGMSNLAEFSAARPQDFLARSTATASPGEIVAPARKDLEHEKLIQATASFSVRHEPKADDTANPPFRQVYIPSLLAAADPGNKAVEPIRSGESTLARSSSQIGQALSLESVMGKGSTSQASDRVVIAYGTGSDKSAFLIPTDRTIIAGNAQATITGPVPLSALSRAIEQVAQSSPVANQSQNIPRVIESAQAAAAAQANLSPGRVQASVEAAAGVLTGGRGVFADPTNALTNRQIQFDASGKAILTPAFNPGSMAGINNALSSQIGNIRVPGQSVNSMDVTGQTLINSSRVDPLSSRPLTQFIGPDGISRRTDLSIDEITRIKNAFRPEEKRFLTGVEIALAIAIASAAVAKHRPEAGQGEIASDDLKALLEAADGKNSNGGDPSDPDSYGQNKTQTASLFKRPVYTIAHNDTLVDIAETYFQNADLAWLIADINKDRITEHEEDGKRIIELRSRQQLELPLPSEAEEFLLTKGKEIKSENLVTFVTVSEIDRELLDSFLSTVIGGETKTESEQIPVEPYLDKLTEEARKPAAEPLLQLMNYGKAMGRNLMPSMSALVRQGQNLRTYISKIDLMPNDTVNLKPEPQR